MEPEKKRLFFALEVAASWPHEYPKGRLLEEGHRHMTMAFLGNVVYEKIKQILPSIPSFPCLVSPVGICDQCIFLPKHFPRVVAWHVTWQTQQESISSFYKQLIAWLRQSDFKLDEREFLPHVTLCRSPFRIREWKDSFIPVPCIVKGLHLYESKGNLRYEPVWSHPIKPAFEEIEHTADIAFHVHGENVNQLYIHALTALAFREPALVSYFPYSEETLPSTLEEVIMQLNKVVAKADGEIGCPFKAVSFHGELMPQEDGTIQWEMIVDV